ncbi:MAG: hypothetical protein AAGI03_07410 [Pseudomonadota bacterium]
MFAALLVLGTAAGLVIATLGHPRIGGALLGSNCRSDDAERNEGF